MSRNNDNVLPPMLGQPASSPQTKRADSPMADQEHTGSMERDPTAMAIDDLIHQESTKARAKAAIAAKKAGDTGSCSVSILEAEGKATRSLGAEEDEAPGKPYTPGYKQGDFRDATSMAAPSPVPTKPAFKATSNSEYCRGGLVRESVDAKLEYGVTFGEQHDRSGRISVGSSTKEYRHSTDPECQTQPTRDDGDIKNWLELTGFHDTTYREQKLAEFRSKSSSHRSQDVPSGRDATSEKKEYTEKMKEMAQRVRHELPPELLQELAAGEPAYPIAAFRPDEHAKTKVVKQTSASHKRSHHSRCVAEHKDGRRQVDQDHSRRLPRSQDRYYRPAYSSGPCRWSSSPRNSYGDSSSYRSRESLQLSSSPRSQRDDEHHHQTCEISGRPARRRGSPEAIRGINRRRRVDTWRAGRPDYTRPSNKPFLLDYQ
ncbi:hypothetical protein IWZ00DRAFT_210528 [Phyllosticta capitalensis]